MTRIRYVKNQYNPNILTAAFPFLTESGEILSVSLNTEEMRYVIRKAGTEQILVLSEPKKTLTALKNAAKNYLLVAGVSFKSETRTRKEKHA